MRSRSQRTGSFRGKSPRKDEAQGSRFDSRASARKAGDKNSTGAAAGTSDEEPPVFRRLADREPEAPPARPLASEPEADLPVFLRRADRRAELPPADLPSPADGEALPAFRRRADRHEDASRPEAPAPQLAAPASKPEFDAYRRALGLLVRREHSRHELKRKLGAKGADPLQAEAALDTLAGQGYQDDARFAEMLVRTRIGAGYGPLHIRAELGTHGIASEVAANALLDGDPDWPALAIDALRRRYGGRPVRDRAESLKRAHYLQRRGFDVACIRAALAVDPDD